MTTIVEPAPAEPSKPCSKCGEIKPLTDYNRAARLRDGRRPDCKTCQSGAMRRYREANLAEVQARDRRYLEANREEIHARRSRYRDANREEINRRQRDNYPARAVQHLEHESVKRRLLYVAVMAWYSPAWPPSCACCGTPDDLSIDHVNGDGAEHREALFGDPKRASHQFWCWLIREEFPAGFQVLCRPCNTSKGRGAGCRIDHAA